MSTFSREDSMDPTTIAGNSVPRTRITLSHAEYSCRYVRCQARRSGEMEDQEDAITKVPRQNVSEGLISCYIKYKGVFASHEIKIAKPGEVIP